MALSKKRKEELLNSYLELLERHSSFVVTTYSGLTVHQLEMLRHAIREVEGEFSIVKNTLARLAFKQAGIELPEDALDGTTAIGFTSGDVAGLAKALMDLAKEADGFSVKYGMIDGVVYDRVKVKQLSELPPLPVVQSQLLSIITAPATKVAGTIAASARQLVNVFNAYAEKDSASA